MDNSNNPNSPYNSNPPQALGATPPPPPDSTSLPFSQPETSIPTSSWPSEPTTLPAYPTAAWPPAASLTQTDPATQAPPWNPTQVTPQPDPIPMPLPQPFNAPQPTSTFTAPEPIQSPEPVPSSPLDNPWGAPTQAPTIDGSTQNTISTTPTQPNWMASSTPTEQPLTPIQTESAPTDLSQLIANNNSQPTEPNTQFSTTPETLVVPQGNAVAPEVPNLPTEGHKGIPKWLIGVGAGLLLTVVGASAYFILGIGQPAKTTSVPAEIQNSTIVKTPAPIATPIPQATETPATGSANFGELGGSETQQATTAADLIRQRQQQGQ